MKLIIKREKLLKELHQINNIISNKPSLPILNNLLLNIKDYVLQFTATDLEIEIITNIYLNQKYKIESITIPARKFYDICRNLPDNSILKLEFYDNKLIIKSNKSYFSISTLPSINFPNINIWKTKINFFISQATLKYLIETTKFSMAQQDIRYYLNGILFEIKEKTIRSVSTDGHRLSICSVKINELLPHHFMILPRKGVIELLRLLDNSETLIELQIGNNNIRIILNNIIFTSKLIDGNFPNYKQILYKNYKKTLEAPCELLKQAFLRTAILSNKKLLVTKLFFSKNQLKITSNNIEQEIAEEIIDIIYNDVDTEIHLNINYILDILNTIKSKKIQFLFNDAYSSVLIKNPENNNLIYIVMPIRL